MLPETWAAFSQTTALPHGCHYVCQEYRSWRQLSGWT